MADPNVPFNPSPGQAYFDELRRKGECVTAPLFQKGGVVANAVPVLVDPQPATASIPDPKHESMADG